MVGWAEAAAQHTHHPAPAGTLLLPPGTGGQRFLAGWVTRPHILPPEIGGAEHHVPYRQNRAVITALLPSGQHAVMRTVEPGRDQQPVANAAERHPCIGVAEALQEPQHQYQQRKLQRRMPISRAIAADQMNEMTSSTRWLRSSDQNVIWRCA